MKETYDLYLVTGATGYLGKALISRLLGLGKKVRALVLPDDPLIGELPQGIELSYGSALDMDSMRDFFAGDLTGSCLLHCAGIISIATKKNPVMWDVNVKGTRNVMDLALKHQLAKAVHISSVHAIPEKRGRETISEVAEFSERKVTGQYAKSKAEGSRAVLEAAKNGLNVSIVHPSGIIGPYDKGKGNIAAVIISFCNGKLPAAVRGGYDFVDVRDVVDGIITCSEKGRAGECYILSGHYASLSDIFRCLRKEGYGKKPFYMPLWLVKALSPFFELSSIVKKQPLFLTPYSAYTLGSNAHFSRNKAAADLNYQPRPLSDTIHDMVVWLSRKGLIPRR